MSSNITASQRREVALTPIDNMTTLRELEQFCEMLRRMNVEGTAKINVSNGRIWFSDQGPMAEPTTKREKVINL